MSGASDRIERMAHEQYVAVRKRADRVVDTVHLSYEDFRRLENDVRARAVFTGVSQEPEIRLQFRYRPNRWIPEGRAVLQARDGEVLGVLDLSREP